MSLATKLFVICASGCGIVPFFIDQNQTSNLNNTEIRNSSFVPKTSTDFAEDSELLLSEEPEEKNCKVIEKLSKNVFWELIKEEEDYVTIYCENSNVDDNGIMPDNWKGLFPKVLFRSQYFHKKGFEFELRTKTKKLGVEAYNTIFYGEDILENSSIIGEWDKKTIFSDGQSFVTINVFGELGKTNSIYILFPDEKDLEI